MLIVAQLFNVFSHFVETPYFPVYSGPCSETAESNQRLFKTRFNIINPSTPIPRRCLFPYGFPTCITHTPTRAACPYFYPSSYHKFLYSAVQSEIFVSFWSVGSDREFLMSAGGVYRSLPSICTSHTLAPK